MPWQLTILLQNVFASVYAIESRRLASKYEKAHFQILAATFMMVYAVFIGYALLNINLINFSISEAQALTLLGVSLAFTVWTVLTFITYRFVDASVGTLLSALNIAAVVVISSLFLLESLKLLQLAGASLLLLSIVVIAFAKETKKRHKNLLIALLLSMPASICFGFAIAGEKHLLNQLGTPTYAFVGIGMQLLWLVILAMFYRRDQFKHFKDRIFRKRVMIMGSVRAGAGLLFVLALVGANNASLIGVLSGLKIILTAILGAILLKEVMFIKRKLLAAVIASIGVGLLLW